MGQMITASRTHTATSKTRWSVYRFARLAIGSSVTVLERLTFSDSTTCDDSLIVMSQIASGGTSSGSKYSSCTTYETSGSLEETSTMAYSFWRLQITGDIIPRHLTGVSRKYNSSGVQTTSVRRPQGSFPERIVRIKCIRLSVRCREIESLNPPGVYSCSLSSFLGDSVTSNQSMANAGFGLLGRNRMSRNQTHTFDIRDRGTTRSNGTRPTVWISLGRNLIWEGARAPLGRSRIDAARLKGLTTYLLRTTRSLSWDLLRVVTPENAPRAHFSTSAMISETVPAPGPASSIQMVLTSSPTIASPNLVSRS